MKHKRSIISIAVTTVVLVSLCAVYTSTSVGAANGSGSSAQPYAGLISAPVAGAPAACAQDTNTVDLFVKGQDGALWYKQLYRPTGSWSVWKSLGGQLTSDPAAACRTPLADNLGSVDVFVRGTNGALYTRSTTNGGNYWSPWHMIGGQILAGTSPAAHGSVLGADNGVGVFVTGTNHQLYHWWADWLGTHSWENLGGYLTSSPAAAPGDAGQLDVFGRGSNGALYVKESWSYDTWWDWFSLGGQIAPGTGPTACSAGSVPHVFVQGTNGALYWLQGFGTRQPNIYWSNWQSLGGKLTSSPGASSRGGGGWIASDEIFVFVRGSDYKLYEQPGANTGLFTSTFYGWTNIGQGPP